MTSLAGHSLYLHTEWTITALVNELSWTLVVIQDGRTAVILSGSPDSQPILHAVCVVMSEPFHQRVEQPLQPCIFSACT